MVRSISTRAFRAALPAILVLLSAPLAARPAAAQVLIAPGVLRYGDVDLVGFGYPAGSDPTTGASLIGLAENAVTVSSNSYAHPFPFSVGAGDYAGMDQIYVGSVQTGFQDGYSSASQRINGPQNITMDYGSLIPAGSEVTGLTLGIAADDFQFQAWHQPFTAKVNGVYSAALTEALQGLNQTGPYEQFLSIGVPLSVLNGSNTLTLTIDEQGNGGDGWAVDFTTVGVQTRPVSTAAPEPGSLALMGMGTLTLLGGGAKAARRRLRR